MACIKCLSGGSDIRSRLEQYGYKRMSNAIQKSVSHLEHGCPSQAERLYFEASGEHMQATKSAKLSASTPSRKYASPVPRREAYGSNENVYNPYQPFASKEYIAQEIAAGRMEPSESSNESPHTMPNMQLGPHRTSLSSRFVTDDIVSPLSTEGRRTPKPNMVTRVRGEGLISMTRMHPGSERVHDTFHLASRDLENTADPIRLASSHVDSPTGHVATNQLEFYDSDEEQQTLPHSHIRRRLHWGNPFSSFDFADPATRQYLEDEDQDTLSSLIEGIEPTYVTFEEASPGPTFEQTTRGILDRKRRRSDRSPENSTSNGQLGLPAAEYRPKYRISATPSGSAKPVLKDNCGLYLEAHTSTLQDGVWSDSEPVGGWQDQVRRGISLSVRQDFTRHWNTYCSFPVAISNPVAVLPEWSSLDLEKSFFTSEVIPRSFTQAKRLELHNIFRTQAPYVPVYVGLTEDLHNRPMLLQYHVAYKPDALRRHNAREKTFKCPKLGPAGRGWPSNSLPLEIFHKITEQLSHEDLRSMRLVNTEFESKTSDTMFRSVVIPFSREIYGMMMEDTGKVAYNFNGKGKSKGEELLSMWSSGLGSSRFSAFSTEQQTIRYEDDNRARKGFFESWGDNVRKFAIAFEVQPGALDESCAVCKETANTTVTDQLAEPPVKGKYESCQAWWGPFNWPPQEYSRYEYCSNLEKKADEYPAMSKALQNLHEVKELGLCIDSGLGWLSGPDVSNRARIFQQKCRVFIPREAEQKAQFERSQVEWQQLNDSSQSNSQRNEPMRTPSLIGSTLYRTGSDYRNTAVDLDRHIIFDRANLDAQHVVERSTRLNLRDTSIGKTSSRFADSPIVPNRLTSPQKEWLMETEWAQNAFLNSYCMAVVDNKSTFQNVRSLTIAKISSKHIEKLQRRDFWTSLTNLRTLTFMIIADFRNIEKNASGVATMTDILPSQAVKPYFKLLSTIFADLKHVKALKLGYVGGGENQTGIFGRNRWVLPAPLADYSNARVFTDDYAGILKLPNVENLTLTNCWVAPPTLKRLVSDMRGSLRSLTLDSVSLTAHTGFPTPLVPTGQEDDLPYNPNGGQRLLHGTEALEDFFAQRSLDRDPLPGPSSSWVYKSPRIASWADVIDTISPGPTLDLVRYAFQYRSEPPMERHVGVSEKVEFISCGYVRLVNSTTLDQSSFPPVQETIPLDLYDRALDLMPVMMHRNDDELVGQITTELMGLDSAVLDTGFPMTKGWSDDYERQLDFLEDGQDAYGNGRFTGRVERFRKEPNCFQCHL